MSGFASFAHAQATFCRSPPAPISQPIRTSPLKSSFVPPSIPSSSRSASPDRADSDGTNSDAGILSDDASDDTGDLSSDAESDLVFFGTPTAQQLDAIARLSHAIPGTPGFPGTPTSSTAATFASPFATPSRKVRRVKKRDSREYLRRQTIVHQPYLATPVRSAAGQDRDEAKAKAKGKGKARAIPQEQAQDRQAGKKVWPGGFFELLQDENRGEDEEGESEYAPTPVRFASSAKGQKGRRTTLSPERVHHDCELTFDFHRLGLSTPVPVGAQSTFAEETHRRPRRSSSASSGLTGGSEMGDVQEMEFSADEELADSDKENCPAPYDQDRHPVEAENQEAEMQIRTDGLLDASFTRAVIFEEDEQGVARVLDMGGLRIDDYGDEDVGGVMDSDDGELSDSSADMERGSPPPEEDAESVEGSAAVLEEEDPEMTPETEEEAAEGAEEGVEERSEEGAEEGADVEARTVGEVTGQVEIRGEGELERAGITVCAQSDLRKDASPTVSRVLSPLADGTTSPIVSAATSPALSQTSPASSATSSPLEMARAPARIPVIPHFSPIVDTALSPSSPVSDLQHNATHAHPAHFASPSPFSDPASLSGLPSRPRQPLYATPTDSPYVTAPSRPIRTPVPLSTPTPATRITSGAGPSLSTPTTRSRGNLGVPSKLALRSQLMSSTKTVPQTIAKAREQAESRKESPETAALKQKMREEQREAAMLASAVKPRAVSASAGANGQSALSSSVSARGRLGMGPPARPGSAMSVSSSTSSATGSTAEQRSISSRSMPSGKSGSSASASTSASSRSAVSRSIPLASRSMSSSTRARPAGVAMLDGPASVTSVSSASSTASRPQQTAGGRLATGKPGSVSAPASARSVLGNRAAPLLSGSTARNAPRPPTAATKQSSLPSRLTASGPLSASNLNAVPSAARVSPARLSGLKRPRSAVPPAAPRTAVAVSSGPSSTGGAVRGALGAHGPPARVVGNRTIPLMSTRPVSPPSPVLHAVADIPSPVAQPSHFMTLYTEPPHFEIGAQPVAVPSSVMRPSGGYGLGGAACRPAPGSIRKNKIFMGTPSRGRTGLTPSKRPAVRPQPNPFDNVFRSIATGGITSDCSTTNGPQHFASSLDSPAGNTRSRPDGSGDPQSASSPSKPARGSSEDFAEVSFMMPHAASSSETGSSPVKRSGKTPSPPLQASSPDEPPSSPPVTRSAYQSPTNKAKAKRATSAPASRAAKTTITKPTPSRPASRTDTIVPNMTEKELKTKTAFNTAKNEKRQCAIDRQVIHIDAPRPPSPTSKIPTTAAREEKAKKMGRDERARRRKQDEEDAKADLGDMLVKREERLQAPGDEEAWVYEDADESKEADVSGPARKRTKTSHEEGDERAKRRVKWDKGVVVIRDFGEGLGKLAKSKPGSRSGPALGGSKDGNSPDSGSSSMGSQSLRMKSILSVERRVELDQYGNLVTTKTAFTVKPQKVVVQAIFYQGEEPYVAPAASTRGKKKSA